MRVKVSALVLACALWAAVMPCLEAQEPVISRGRWTPQITGEQGATGQSYFVQYGEWVKVGPLITASFDVFLLAKGQISGRLVIAPLPFPVAAFGDGGGVIGAYEFLPNPPRSLMLRPYHLSNFAYLMGAYGGTSAAHLTAANIGDLLRLTGTVTYIAVE